MNNDLIRILQEQLSGNTLSSLSNRLKLNDQSQAASATENAVNMLLSALTKNATSQEGLSSIAGALDKDHDGSILDDLAGFIGGNANFSNPKMTNGAGILSHVLGDNLGKVVELISSNNNLNSSQSNNLLQILAPVVMGAIGKSKRQQNVNQGGLLDLLKQSTDQYQQQSSNSNNILKSLLDKDGDGKIADEVTSIGKNLLGKLFNK